MNEKVTLEELKKQIQGQREDKIIVRIGVLNDLISQIEKQQTELEKKDKVIHLMARELKQRRYIFGGGRGHKFIIDFFTQKIEKGE